MYFNQKQQFKICLIGINQIISHRITLMHTYVPNLHNRRMFANKQIQKEM